MQKSELIKAAFGMLAQPVILTKRELIEYMNPEAVALAGEDKTGKPIGVILPSQLTNIQADNYITSAFVGGRNCTVKASTAEGMKIYALSLNENDFCGNAMLYANLRSTLSNLKFISNCITNLAENDGNERLMSYVAPLNRSYFKIKHSLNNASMAENLSQGKLACMPEYTDLAALCRDMIETVKLIIARKDANKDVSISFNSEEHVYVNADGALMEQLILNLLSNSMNHILPDGRIRVSLLKTGTGTIISVDDDGQGIPTDELSKVFESYKHKDRLENAASGTGLGLVIVRGIAQMHGGTVVVESRGEGKGTAVRVMISNEGQSSASLRSPITPYAENSMERILTELTDSLRLDCHSHLYDD